MAGALLAGAGGLLAGLGFAAEAAVWAYLTDPGVVPAGAGVGAAAPHGVEESPWIIDAPILGGFALITVGVLVLLAALWRSGTVPRWVPIAGIVAALATQVPLPDALRAVPALAGTTILVGITGLAMRRLRTP